MSDPKLISPLLDHFAIGGAISDHDGVRCYPAMREESDDKYIYLPFIFFQTFFSEQMCPPSETGVI